MKVLVTGGTGLIGSALRERLRKRGDEVVVASRTHGGEGFVRWDPTREGSLRLPDRTDAVVHLAGAPVMGRRWDEDYKKTIRDSRVEGTRTVIEAIRDYDGSLDVFVSSSAVGFYGDRGDDPLTEDSEPGEDFMARVCRDWEREARALNEKFDAGVSTAIVRTGVVLSTTGGALARMLEPIPGLRPFHWGLGGPIGRGQQFMPWIHLEDEVGILVHLLDHESSGTFNLTAPNPVRNNTFTKALGNVLDRPTVFPVPPLALRLLYGEAADVLLASQRVIPKRIRNATDYSFRYPSIEGALEDLLAV